MKAGSASRAKILAAATRARWSQWPRGPTSARANKIALGSIKRGHARGAQAVRIPPEKGQVRWREARRYPDSTHYRGGRKCHQLECLMTKKVTKMWTIDSEATAALTLQVSISPTVIINLKLVACCLGNHRGCSFSKCRSTPSPRSKARACSLAMDYTYAMISLPRPRTKPSASTISWKESLKSSRSACDHFWRRLVRSSRERWEDCISKEKIHS